MVLVSQREKMLDEVSSLFNGKLNMLINNVGTTLWKPTMEYSAEEYSMLMATNGNSAFHLCQLAYPLLKASGGVGSIVFISSVAGLVHTGSGSVYGASKVCLNLVPLNGLDGFNHLFLFVSIWTWMLDGLSLILWCLNLASEWAKDNIRSNCVTSFCIRTPLLEHVCKVKFALMESKLSNLTKPSRNSVACALEHTVNVSRPNVWSEKIL
ncbi:hypothetical protein ACSBR1_007699 [Camellia fascicularis]